METNKVNDYLMKKMIQKEAIDEILNIIATERSNEENLFRLSTN